MSGKGNSELFDAYYFAHSCGRPYQRDEHWLNFFATIAERIAQELQPRTVMDVGCAMGFLVEALRERDIEAFGIDVSEYAINEIIPEIKPYCRVSSVLDAFQNDYDLMVCIEVLEHLKPEEAERAIRNLCTHTTQVLFSSTPSDYKEATHFNVQPPHYWAELFARNGFYHDLDFDASFITPWAMLFKYEKISTPRVVKHYERERWEFQQEITGLRSFSLAMRKNLVDHETLIAEKAELEAKQEKIFSQLNDAEEEIQRLQDKISDYQKITLEKDQLEKSLELERSRIITLQNQLQEMESVEEEKQKLEQFLEDSEKSLEAERVKVGILTSEKESIESEKIHLGEILDDLAREKQVIQGRLSELEAHVGWRLVTRVQRFRIKLFPVGSSRERIWKAGVAFLRAWLDLGFWSALRKTLASARGKPIGHTPDSEYQNWIKYKELSIQMLNEQRETALSFSYRPLISVITPVYNPPPDVLREALESILAQTYDQWEMCIADASTDSEVHQILETYSQSEPRITVHVLQTNEGIAGNSNRALDHAVGEFIAIFDHDDRLAPNALFEVVQALNNRDVDILYFDEDKLSSDGKVRKDPWFKPDWSPELLLSANYLMHSVIRRSLVEEVGGFKESMEATQDWDLLLRCTTKTEKIVHIPKVLYHWRQIPGSVASNLLAKPWVFENQRKCLRAHLERIGIENPEADFDSPGFVRLSWPTANPLVSIIIPSKDKVDLLRRCVGSLVEITEYSNYEIILVDNESEDWSTHAYYETLKGESRIRFVLYPGEFNFSAANNLGAREAKGRLLLFLNNDVEILELEWLEEMVRWAERPEVGIVGAKLLYPNGLIQHAGVVIGMQGHASHVFMGSMEKQTGPFGSVDWYRNYSAVTGACMMISKDVFEEVGGFDEGYKLVFSDVEICLRVLKEGYRIVYTPYARLRHYEGQSRGMHIPASDMLRGYEHMKEMVEVGDRYYNENLSYAECIPTIMKFDEEARIRRLKRLIGGDEI